MNESSQHFIEVANINIPELSVFASSSERELLHYYEPDIGVFVAESLTVIERALAAGYEPLSFFLEKRHLTGAASEIITHYPNAKVYYADIDIMSQITGYALTGGALCLMRRQPTKNTETIIGNATKIAVLEDVENPTNVGAIFRSAAALGMDAVLLTDSCANPLYRRAARVSMGTVFAIPWTYVKCGSDAAALLHRFDFSCLAMSLSDVSVPIDSIDFNKCSKTALFFGNEAYGLTPDTISSCDKEVIIPMQRGVDSLNVAASSAVAFWTLNH